MTLYTDDKLNEKIYVNKTEDYIELDFCNILNQCRRGDMSIYNTEIMLKHELIGKSCDFIVNKGYNKCEYYAYKYVDDLYITVFPLTINLSCDDKWATVDENYTVKVYFKNSKKEPKIRWYKGGQLLEESIINKNISFIPFELRDQLDVDFENSDINDYKKLRLNPNYSYLRIITSKVIDKIVTFYTFNYLLNKTSVIPITWKINRVHFNNNGLIVFDGRHNANNETSCIDERKEVIINESLYGYF
jgi:hypothetical protein